MPKYAYAFLHAIEPKSGSCSYPETLLSKAIKTRDKANYCLHVAYFPPNYGGGEYSIGKSYDIFIVFSRTPAVCAFVRYVCVFI